MSFVISHASPSEVAMAPAPPLPSIAAILGSNGHGAMAGSRPSRHLIPPQPIGRSRAQHMHHDGVVIREFPVHVAASGADEASTLPSRKPRRGATLHLRHPGGLGSSPLSTRHFSAPKEMDEMQRGGGREDLVAESTHCETEIGAVHLVYMYT